MAPDSQAKSIEVVSWTLAGIAVILVLARLYTRCWLTRKPGWDDFFMGFSLVSALICSILVQIGISYGLGMHLTDIADHERRITAYKYTVIAPNFSIVSTTTGKISIVFFLLRLMGHASTGFKRWFLYGLTIVSIGLNIFAIVVIMGFCIPAEKIWRPETPGSCMSPMLLLIGGMVQASFNALTDLILAIFPIFIFWELHMEAKVRLALVGVMGAGIFAAAATLVKTVLLKHLPEQDDITWAWASITLWYSAEMYVIIICATIPTLRQFYFEILGIKSGRSGYSRSKGGKPYNNPTDTGNSIPLEEQQRRRRLRKKGSLEALGMTTTLVGETVIDGASSQEEILSPRSNDGIHKTTDVYVKYGNGGDSTQVEADPRKENPHFPHQNPFATTR